MVHITTEEVRKMNLNDGDILILPDVFSTAYKTLLQQELTMIYPNKKVGMIFVPNPDAVRIIKADGVING